MNVECVFGIFDLLCVMVEGCVVVMEYDFVMVVFVFLFYIILIFVIEYIVSILWFFC